MDPRRSKAEERKDHESKIVIRRYIDRRPRCPGVFIEYPWRRWKLTVGIDRLALHGRCERTFTRADCHIEKGIFSVCDRFEAGVPQKKTEDHFRGFILDRWDAGTVHFVLGFARVAVHAHAVVGIINTGGRVTDSKPGGILQDDPSKEQAREFKDPDHDQQQQGQNQRKFQDGLRPGFG